MATTTGTTWYNIATTVISALSSHAFYSSAIYYNRIRTGTCNAMTQSEANVMMWINIIIAIAFFIHFLWSARMMLYVREFNIVFVDLVETPAT